MNKNQGAVGQIPSWTGLSTEDKPRSPGQGATLYCVDTGERWIFSDGMWSIDLSTSILAPKIATY